MVTIGEPLWTSGHFNRRAAQDDLGIEAVGAGLLRELIPGVVQTSISAGYYAYYPFLLDEFERRWPDELRRSEFQPFYRRQEAAFAVGCSQHDHRGALRGINGVTAAAQAAEAAGPDGEIDLAALALPGRYMKTGLGGYGLFYRPALADAGVTRLGSGNSHIDRPTDLGRRASEGFRVAIGATEYWRRWSEADVVPLSVLVELGEAVCPCLVPDRADHEPILETLFRATGGSERWETLRRYRVQSFGLMLEFQSQRPDVAAGIGEWRRALISGQIDGLPWETAFGRHREAWRAYQYRETVVAAMTTLFTDVLLAFEEFGESGLGDVEELLFNRVAWADLPCQPETPFGELVASVGCDRVQPVELIARAELAMGAATPVGIGESLASAIWLLAALADIPAGGEEFAELLERGGDHRLSVGHMGRWFETRSDVPVQEVVRQLVRFLFHRHMQVATAKLTPNDHRDPFCLEETEDGIYRVCRPDEPFWTGARFETLNHLLWTAGALDSPEGAGRPTALGRSMLEVAQRDA